MPNGLFLADQTQFYIQIRDGSDARNFHGSICDHFEGGSGESVRRVSFEGGVDR